VWGCAPQPRPVSPAVKPVAEARDLLLIHQDLRPYLPAETLDRPFINPENQARLVERFTRLHYGPWTRTAPAYSRQEALWGLGQLKRGKHYGENLRLLGPGFKAEMEALAQADTYPNAGLPAIATANAALRVLPTGRPGFLKPTDPGEGYPFDYWQNSGVWAGTPLYVSQLSADGAWALVETRFAGGWMPVSELAFVDEAFVARWMSLPLAAVTRERTPLVAEGAPGEQQRDGFLSYGRIGTVLPLEEQNSTHLSVLAPARGVDGRAVIKTVRLAKADATPMPLAPTPRNFALLAGQMMGQPYGWGGYLDNRDCSALMLDLYAPFGIFMPRNSGQQARAGEVVGLAGLSPEQKERQILDRGAPLLTLLHKPGHIMLYVGPGTGPNAGRAMILHAIWGLKTIDEQGAVGRFVIGRTALTTLEPGKELPEVARAGTLLGTLDSLTLVAPEASSGPALVAVPGSGQDNGQGAPLNPAQ
jgi:cell wall-associated NlpC family hydrolase